MSFKLRDHHQTERKTKYGNAAVLIGIALFLCIAAFLQIHEYRNHLQLQEEYIYQVASADAEGSAGEQTAASILKGNKDDKRIKAGKEKLEQYGYDEDYVTIYDKQFQIYRNNAILTYAIIYLVFLAGICVILGFKNRKREQELEEISELLSKFYDGDYSVPVIKEEGDNRNKLYSQLESLGKVLALKEKNIKREKEETKSLVTDISHQLKTPIASLKMCFSLLEEDNLEKEERREFMNRLKEQIEQLEGLTAALVNISRMETGMIAIEKENKNIFDTVLKAVNSVYMKAEEKNIRIEIDNAAGDDVEGLVLPHDEKWTKEAIANVLDNGIKYSKAGAKIGIRMIKQINFLRIEIEDEGIGIEKEEYNQIFKRFYRGKADIVKQAEGSGVGLYLTRKILEEQGGSIIVKSAKKLKDGKSGSTFILQLSLR